MSKCIFSFLFCVAAKAASAYRTHETLFIPLIQLHDAKLSAQELAALLPRKIRDNEELREQMTLKEQELDRNRVAVSEAEETRDQFLKQAALVRGG